MPEHPFHSREPTPAAAFAALPLDTPDRSAWPALVQAMAARTLAAPALTTQTPPARRHRHRPLWLAAAALLALAVVLPLLLPAPPSDAPLATAPPATAVTESQLTTLMRESARLEAVVAFASNDDVASAAAAALGSQLEDRLRTIDAELARTDDALQLPLWRQRVATLHALAQLESSRQWLAARGERYDGALVVTD